MKFNRTDLVKMGKYMAKLRKEKKYTQRELSEFLDVSDKTVSKWENGVVAPDITILKELANILGVSVDELLYGEKIDDVEVKNSVTVDGINYYIKKAKNKIFRIMTSIIIIVVIFLAYFFVKDYYRWNVFNFSSNSEEYFIKGFLASNREKSIFIIDGFSYFSDKVGTSDEDKVKKMKVSLFYDDAELISKEYIYDAPVLLHRCFENYSLSYEDNNIFIEEVKNVVVSISYINENDECYFFQFDLEKS